MKKACRSVLLLALLSLFAVTMVISGCAKSETSSKNGEHAEESVVSGKEASKEAGKEGEHSEGSESASEGEHEDGPPETRQGAHEFSDEQAHEALLQTLDALLELETITVSIDALREPLERKALDQYRTSIQSDLDKGRYKVRDFQDIKLSYYNYTVGVVGISVEYKDRSYYADTVTNKPLTERSAEVRRLVLASEKIDNRWKIVSFFDPTRKPGADEEAGSTTTSVPSAVNKIEKDLGYQ